MSSERGMSVESEAVLASRVAALEAEIADLRKGEIWYRDTIEAAEVGTWAWDLHSGELTWSSRCKALFGFAPDAQIDYDVFLQRLHPEDRERVDQAVQTALRSTEAYDAYSRVIWSDESIHWLRFKGKAYIDESGAVTRFQGIVIDVENQKRAEQELREALHKQVETHARAVAAESEAARILESMAEGFYGLDFDFRFTYLNHSAEEILGRTRLELLHTRLWEAYPELIGTEMEALYRKAMLDRSVEEFTTLFDPWNRWFSCKVYPTETGLTVYFREITQQKQIEVALLDSQERFEMINNFIPVMVWTTRPDGYHDYFNRRWTEYTGLTVNQTQGWGWSDLLHPDDTDRSIARWKHSLETGESYEIEYRLKRTDGVYHWFLGQALPVKDRHGNIVRWFGTCTEIDDRKRVEGELAAARQTAEEASQAKSHFLASMSHELRTPLNAIIGYSEMLQEEIEDLGVPQLAPDLGKIHSAGKHLLALISDILDLSKIEAGKMDVFAEEFDLAETVREVAATVEPLIRKNGNELKLEIAPDAGRMFTDLTKVRQTLFNLLSNASKFTQNGTVTVGAFSEGDFVVLRVADTGIGIDPAKISNLFEPFSQLHGSSVKAGGTGLGLAITKRFCEMLGGDIFVDSTLGEGSAFGIRLPRVLLQAGDAAGLPATVLPALGEARGKGLVLVVDDDATARDLMNRYLLKEGYRTVLASSGEQGLRLARELKPNVITLDVIMPGMDGWAVLQTLKADPELNCIPVVMVTMMGDRSLGFALGAADFVVKPVTRDKMTMILSKFRCATPPCRVLVVEDDDSSRQLACSIFSKEGWLVSDASNGLEGLERVREEKPSLILLDLMMPMMDGFEFTLELRREPQFRDIPVVVLTAKDITADDRRRLSGNVEKVLSKGSLSNEQVLNEIREILNQCV
ncbi:MAG: response regulator [Bryobacteraceae bacterium]|nr:response regulator [Bryobacteraceae bacterium]